MKAPGTCFGPYEITSVLGRGGMGIVYRAVDTRLLRDVAIKVLPDSVAYYKQALERFEREARSASALNHPNVVTVYDIGQVDGEPYLAMELVEGRTLRELMQAGPLPVRKTIALATQIAHGLAAAHSRGIVHRDLKPENVMVTPEERVKILDFGLAKLFAPLGDDGASPEEGKSDAPTNPGTILGTVGYMSPEQAAGRPTDFRTDQFALGALVYEMLTTRAPFKRATFAETLTAIIREEPEPFVIDDPQLAGPARWILERCLAKDPAERYGSTTDLARDLERLYLIGQTTPSGQRGLAVFQRPRPQRPRLQSVLLVTVGAGIMLGLGLLLGRQRPVVPRYQKLTFSRGTIWNGRFGPDGRSVFYSAAWNGRPFQVFQKHPESPESVALGIPPADVLAVSSTGELAVLLDPVVIPPGRTTGVLARVPFTGGAPRRILEDAQYADWNPDGKDLAVVRSEAGRSVLEWPVGRRIHETGGWLSHVRVAPDGESVAVIEHPTAVDTRGHIIVLHADGRRERSSTEWPSLDGLAWTAGNEIWAAAAGERELRSIWAIDRRGGRRLVAMGPGRLSLLDIAKGGAVLCTREQRQFGIAVADAGQERDLSYFDSSLLADLSADGQNILFTEFGEAVGGAYETFMRRTDGSPPERLGEGFAKALSPDGRSALAVLPIPPERLHLLSIEGGTHRDVSHPDLVGYLWASFLPDGKLLVASARAEGVSLFVQSAAGDEYLALQRPPINLQHVLGLPVSPDGRWLAALSTRYRLMLVPLVDGQVVSVPGIEPGILPVGWGRDSHSLFVFRPQGLPSRIEKVDPFTGQRALLWEIRPADPAGIHGLPVVRVTPDGSKYAYSYARFLHELYLGQGLK